jgi:hypothetical protein
MRPLQMPSMRSELTISPMKGPVSLALCGDDADQQQPNENCPPEHCPPAPSGQTVADGIMAGCLQAEIEA